MHVSLEGLPAVGKSEVLALLRLYYPDQVLVLPELVKEVAEREGLDLFRDRPRLGTRIWDALPARMEAIHAAQETGKVVLEESHLGVHAAYAAALGDEEFLAQFRKREGEIRWPDRFIRLGAPIPVSLVRQAARGDPRYTVPQDVLVRMLTALDAWHLQRKSALGVIDADRPPAEVVAELVGTLGLTYRAPSLGPVIPYLFLLGRPASGKSELIQFLRGLSPEERATTYHLGTLRGLDDFPILWRLFLEDDLWERIGRGRLHSRRAGENYAVANDHVWPFLTLRLVEELAQRPAGPGETVIVEFARGGVDGYRKTLGLFPTSILREAALLYLSVPAQESWRRNLARYDRARRDGILTHSVPEEEMARTYAVDDWISLAPKPEGHLTVRGIPVPYVTVPNVPEPLVPADFARRFRPALEALWALHRAR